MFLNELLSMSKIVDDATVKKRNSNKTPNEEILING